MIVAGQGNIGDIVSDSTSLYWTDTGPDIYASDGTVARSALDGSNVTVLALGQSEPLDLTVDSTSVYWTNFAGGASSNGSVMEVSLSGGEATLLASSDAPYAIAVDATSVYWTDYDDETISKAALDRSQRTTHPAHAPRRARKNLGGARAHNLLSRRPCLPMLQNASVC
jgi:hypothetical protein